jgi:hypothetical protein
MSATYSAVIVQGTFSLRNRFKHLTIPQYHILILAWSALVILYGETDPSRSFRNKARNTGYGTVASR